MSGYENAPATKMIAVSCACCARPLVDAVSVELGIGPDCRKKYLAMGEASEEARAEANALIHKIACVQEGVEAFEACKALHKLGFQTVSARIMERLTKIVIEQEGTRLAVWTPYRLEAVEAMKKVPGRQWDKDRKVNTFPATVEAKRAVWNVLTSFFHGQWANGPRGPFVVGSAQ